MFNMFSYATAGTIAMIIGLNGGVEPTKIDPVKQSDPIRCEIETSSNRGMTTMQGVIYSDQKVRGTYRFSLKSKGRSGGTNIQQGGEFSVGRDGHAGLGMINIGGRVSDYKVRLKVRVKGKTITCGTDDVTNI